MKRATPLLAIVLIVGAFAWLVAPSIQKRVELGDASELHRFGEYVAFQIPAADASPQSPPTSPGTATVETLGGILRTDGWCANATTTLQNFWTLAPSRVTTAIKSQVRFVKVRYSDRTSSGDVCVRLGPSTAHKSDAGSTGDPVSCDLGTESSGPIQAQGEYTSYAIARDVVSTSPSTPLTTPPALWVLATATTKVCVEVGW